VSNIFTFNNRSGFTLIELLVVIAIVGILAAIAVPQYAAYRNRGFDAQVKYDLKNAALAEERFFSLNLSYQPCGPACTSADLQGFVGTTGVSVQAIVAGQTFTLTGTHIQCGASTWTYSSVTGVIVPPGPPCG
jgi:prepilin-type N-terminal cleavage/methylation domain-containing protein